MKIKEDDKKYLKAYLLILCVLLTYMLLFMPESVLGWIRQLLNIVKPFIFGFVIAYFINIPCAALEKLFIKTGKNRSKKRRVRSARLYAYSPSSVFSTSARAAFSPCCTTASAR
jgi:hypothetical protein